MTRIAFHPGTLIPIRKHADRKPTEAELFPHLEKDNVCIYCGRFQTDAEAEQRTRTHITEDLLAVHRTNEGLIRDFGIQHPGYRDDVYDLLCELDAAEAGDRAAEYTAALAEVTTR